MTLKKGQDHKIWYELVDPNQCHNNAKLQKKLRVNSVLKKPTINFLPNQKTRQFYSLKYVRESGTAVYS